MDDARWWSAREDAPAAQDCLPVAEPYRANVTERDGVTPSTRTKSVLPAGLSAGDLVLDSEHVGFSVDQLHRYAQAIGFALHTAIDQVTRIKVPADLARIEGLGVERE